MFCLDSELVFQCRFAELAAMQSIRSSKPPRSGFDVRTDFGNGAGEGPSNRRPWALLFLLAIVSFLPIECSVPLRTAVQIGADEGIRIGKAV